MTKLLYITNGINGSAGLERVLSIKAGYLAEHLDYDVHILVLNDAGKNLFYDFSPKITIHSIPVGGNPIQYFNSYLSGIKAVIGNVKPDLISVCDDGLKAFFLPTLLGKPCPMIYERHVSKRIALGANPDFSKKAIYEAKLGLMNVLGRNYGKFVVLTKENVKEWNLKNIEVIPNPLSFYPDGAAMLTNKIAIAVGKQSYQKGYDRLLNAWHASSGPKNGWELHIYGKQDPNQKLRELAASLGISDSVKFFDAVKDIEAKIKESSILCFSSRFEGFGMVLIEAMACGVPCVSFDCPCGPSDIIKDGEDGFLVENGDTNQFAKKLDGLISDHELRIKMGSAARTNVRRYLSEAVMPKWDALFKKLLS